MRENYYVCTLHTNWIIEIEIPDFHLSLSHFFPQILIFVLQGLCSALQLLEDPPAIRRLDHISRISGQWWEFNSAQAAQPKYHCFFFLFSLCPNFQSWFQQPLFFYFLKTITYFCPILSLPLCIALCISDFNQIIIKLESSCCFCGRRILQLFN